MVSDHRRPLVIFALVVVYVIFQFLWWAYLLLEQNQALARLQQELLRSGVMDPSNTVTYSKWMVIGEGTVFVTLLALGVWLTYRTLRRELSLAHVQHDFLLAVTHELRTPIAGMRLNLQTMQRNGLKEAVRKELLEHAVNDTKRLEALSDRILMATQLEEEALFMDRTMIPVTVRMGQILESARATYASKHELEQNIDEDVKWPLDEIAFRSICDNLIENACKYSPQGSSILVSMAIENSELSLRVQDEGSGIDDIDGAHIFKKFHRGTTGGHQAKGSGLGLFITAQLVKAMDGRIEHRPRRPQGSCFEATFPWIE